ncbi:MAG: iron chaperone [Candidatus Izemoplasmataceae bacterium]
MNYETFLETIKNPLIKEKMMALVDFVQTTFPHLKLEIKWNQPMFTDHGTFIIGFSAAKNHINLAPEQPVISLFKEKLDQASYHQTKMLIQIKAHQSIDYTLVKEIIEFTITDKKDTNSFWR